jgi:hypothetical protein
MIMVFIVGGTLGINALMKGKVMNFLLNKKLLLLTASVISVLITFGFVMTNEYYRDWVEVFWLVYFIGLFFVGAKYTPDLVLHLKKIHLSNIEDAEEQELRDAN